MKADREITLGDLKGCGNAFYNEPLFNQLVEENRTSMTRYVRHRFAGIDPSTAEDLVQSVFEELVRIVFSNRVRNANVPARKWLFKTLYYRCLSQHQQNQTAAPPPEASAEEIVDQYPDPTPPPLDVILEAEELELVIDCVENHLQGRVKEVIKLSLWEGRRPIEVAEMLNVCQAFVATYKRRGISQLKRCLKQKGVVFNNVD